MHDPFTHIYMHKYGHKHETQSEYSHIKLMVDPTVFQWILDGAAPQKVYHEMTDDADVATQRPHCPPVPRRW